MFVREPEETTRFDRADADLTATALWPILMGANGSLQIGALVAFLSYLMQNLVTVMIVTFISVTIPCAAVCAERIRGARDVVVGGAVEAPMVPRDRGPNRAAPCRSSLPWARRGDVGARLR